VSPVGPGSASYSPRTRHRRPTGGRVTHGASPRAWGIEHAVHGAGHRRLRFRFLIRERRARLPDHPASPYCRAPLHRASRTSHHGLFAHDCRGSQARPEDARLGRVGAGSELSECRQGEWHYSSRSPRQLQAPPHADLGPSGSSADRHARRAALRRDLRRDSQTWGPRRRSGLSVGAPSVHGRRSHCQQRANG